MMNKKLIALLVAVATVSAISAEYCYTDRYGNERCEHRGIVRGTVDTADDIATGTVDATLGSGSILNPGNWGERGRERREEAREIRRERRQDRRYGY